MDFSAGTTSTLVSSKYPYGLPCVSDESQSDFMEAVYQQQVMPNNITGVDVTLSVIDSNNNFETSEQLRVMQAAHLLILDS